MCHGSRSVADAATSRKWAAVVPVGRGRGCAAVVGAPRPWVRRAISRPSCGRPEGPTGGRPVADRWRPALLRAPPRYQVLPWVALAHPLPVRMDVIRPVSGSPPENGGSPAVAAVSVGAAAEIGPTPHPILPGDI